MTRASAIAILLAACGPRGSTVNPPGVDAAPAGPTTRRSAFADPPAPTRDPTDIPSLPTIAAADREALAKAGEPTIVETTVPGGVETTLVLRAGAAEIVLARARWDLDQCERFSDHFAVVDAAHGLVDARLNCHFGEDFWTTEVVAQIVVVDLGQQEARPIWSGAERYTGAMDECLTAEPEVAVAIEDATVWVATTAWAEWEPQDPGEPLVPQAECVRPAVTDTRTALARLAPGP